MYICDESTIQTMKKAFFRFLGIILGLNVFTACYGPAPGGNWDYDEPKEQTDTKAVAEEEQPAEAAPQEAPQEASEEEAQ